MSPCLLILLTILLICYCGKMAKEDMSDCQWRKDYLEWRIPNKRKFIGLGGCTSLGFANRYFTYPNIDTAQYNSWQKNTNLKPRCSANTLPPQHKAWRVAQRCGLTH